ncbi:hypothetical protein [Fontivita pretiosa]|uniref:hypothetical protein n=1 Tax=Fontivita pretiosa TaxID=2989684 RepID=UPI003D17DEA6
MKGVDRFRVAVALVGLQAIAWLAGCSPRQPTGGASRERKPVIAITQPPGQAAGGSSPGLDASPPDPLRFNIELFVLSVPHGAISGNEQFWKRIDEQVFDVPTAELLDKNGIRVGVAAIGEIQHLARFLDEATPAQRLNIAGPEARDAEVIMNADLPEQVVFHFDARNVAVGRSYDRCENAINLSFQPAPRKPGYLRLKLCPMVRTTRKRVQFTKLNDAYELQFVSPEMLYDLNFRVDLSRDRFLVVAPSQNAILRPTSVGGCFLIRNTPTERVEQVLIVIPQAYRPRTPPAQSPQVSLR